MTKQARALKQKRNDFTEIKSYKIESDGVKKVIHNPNDPNYGKNGIGESFTWGGYNEEQKDLWVKEFSKKRYDENPDNNKELYFHVFNTEDVKGSVSVISTKKEFTYYDIRKSNAVIQERCANELELTIEDIQEALFEYKDIHKTILDKLQELSKEQGILKGFYSTNKPEGAREEQKHHQQSKDPMKFVFKKEKLFFDEGSAEESTYTQKSNLKYKLNEGTRCEQTITSSFLSKDGDQGRLKQFNLGGVTEKGWDENIDKGIPFYNKKNSKSEYLKHSDSNIFETKFPNLKGFSRPSQLIGGISGRLFSFNLGYPCAPKEKCSADKASYVKWKHDRTPFLLPQLTPNSESFQSKTTFLFHDLLNLSSNDRPLQKNYNRTSPMMYQEMAKVMPFLLILGQIDANLNNYQFLYDNDKKLFKLEAIDHGIFEWNVPLFGVPVNLDLLLRLGDGSSDKSLRKLYKMSTKNTFEQQFKDGTKQCNPNLSQEFTKSTYDFCYLFDIYYQQEKKRDLFTKGEKYWLELIRKNFTIKSGKISLNTLTHIKLDHESLKKIGYFPLEGVFATSPTFREALSKDKKLVKQYLNIIKPYKELNLKKYSQAVYLLKSYASNILAEIELDELRHKNITIGSGIASIFATSGIVAMATQFNQLKNVMGIIGVSLFIACCSVIATLSLGCGIYNGLRAMELKEASVIQLGSEERKALA